MLLSAEGSPAKSRSLLGQRGYARGHGQIFCHPSQHHGTNLSEHDAAAIGARIRGVLADGLPLVTMKVVVKAEGGSFRGLSIVGDAFVIVRSGRASGKKMR